AAAPSGGEPAAPVAIVPETIVPVTREDRAEPVPTAIFQTTTARAPTTPAGASGPLAPIRRSKRVSQASAPAPSEAGAQTASPGDPAPPEPTNRPEAEPRRVPEPAASARAPSSLFENGELQRRK